MNFDVGEARDVLVSIGDVLGQAPDVFGVVEQMIQAKTGQPLHMRRFTISDFSAEGFDESTGLAAAWIVDIGGDWTVEVSRYDNNYYLYTNTNTCPNANHYMVKWVWGSNYVAWVPFSMDNGKAHPEHATAEYARKSFSDGHKRVRQKVASIIRQHRIYLKDSALYDMLETELNIKTRKLK